MDVIGFVPEQGQAEPSLDVPRIDGNRLLETAAERGASELVLALSHPPPETLLKTLLVCQEAGAQVVRVQTLTEQVLHRVPVDFLEPDWLMTELAGCDVRPGGVLAREAAPRHHAGRRP